MYARQPLTVDEKPSSPLSTEAKTQSENAPLDTREKWPSTSDHDASWTSFLFWLTCWETFDALWGRLTSTR